MNCIEEPCLMRVVNSHYKFKNVAVSIKQRTWKSQALPRLVCYDESYSYKPKKSYSCPGITQKKNCLLRSLNLLHSSRLSLSHPPILTNVQLV